MKLFGEEESNGYRIGFPLWRQAARLGVPLSLRVDVIHDAEAQMYVATSEDLRGLVCEAATIEELRGEVEAAVMDLLDVYLKRRVSPPVTDLM